MMHRDLWTDEFSGSRVLHDLPTLDPFEQSLYDDLRNDRLGDRPASANNQTSCEMPAT